MFKRDHTAGQRAEGGYTLLQVPAQSEIVYLSSGHILIKLKAADESFRPTRAYIRKLIDNQLRTDALLDAFCLDHFHEVEQMFSAGMERIQKVNLLLRMVDTQLILDRLQECFESNPEHFSQIK